ncbi:NAD(P)/FAD-dependent oxidoreductase [Subtercola boreus]|uniref:NAD(P)/FAD-dependent oxidoreductase n=1 Tax=Subtercola boreus TaxID=120213 RepID=UPI0011675F64|nr:FAD-dependent oxidoreductase [Subtercola boreus]TQL56109.1 NAD/ferredoxin-dependent reductase-like protein [Subtercola boreus]
MDLTPEHVVVVGASLAGLRAVEAARRLGFPGRLTLVGDEEHLPYDRPPLSKEYLGDLPGVAPMLATAEDLRELDVELLLGAPAEALDLTARSLLIGGESVAYDRLLIATGATPRRLPGSEGLSGVCTLRGLSDAIRIRAAFDAGARVVVIGAGFIGSELASSARARGLDVTIVEALTTPLVRAVGAGAGAALSALHERNGTELLCGVGVEGLEQQRGAVTGVRLADGRLLPADLVIVGIGVVPATGWLAGSGLELENGIVVDETLRATADVWAAGDVARWMSPDFETLLRLEHWTNAAEMGAHAMKNLLDPEAAEPYRHIPYFWSDWYGHRIQFAGVPTGEPEVVTGSWTSDEFAALYHDGDRVVGALTLDRRGDIMKYRAMIGRRTSRREALAFAASRRQPIVAAAG